VSLNHKFTLSQAFDIEGELARLERQSASPIHLRISSVRGEFAAAEHLRRVIERTSLNVPIYGVVVGIAYGAGLYALQACSVRLALPTAKFKITDMNRDRGESSDPEDLFFAERVVNTYLNRLEWRWAEMAIRNLMKSGKVFEAVEAKRIGLIDEVFESMGVVR
jgi:enoyl-CoA hydratase/carnithine racemase